MVLQATGQLYDEVNISTRSDPTHIIALDVRD